MSNQFSINKKIMRVQKTLFAFLLFTFLFSMNSFSQERTNVIKANPFALAFGSFNATYEKVLNSKSSLLFSGSYAYKLLNTDVSAGGLGVGYRYYFTHAKKEVPSGFWVNPQASFEAGSLTDNGTKHSLSAFAIGAQIGYQWAWASGFTLDLGIGPNYVTMNSSDYDFETGSGIMPAATLAIGFAF